MIEDLKSSQQQSSNDISIGQPADAQSQAHLTDPKLFSKAEIVTSYEPPLKRFKVWLGIGITSFLIVAGGIGIYFVSYNSSEKPTSTSAQVNLLEKEALDTIPSTIYNSLLVSPNLELDDLDYRDVAEFESNINQYAKDSTVLYLSECRIVPLIARVKNNSKITFVNEDDSARTLYVSFEERIEYTVDPHTTIDVTLDFPNGEGIYTFGCDLKSGNSGYFLVYN